MKYVNLMVIILLLTVTSAWCAAPSLEAVVKALQDPFSQNTPAARQIHDFQADFAQRSHIASINREQRGSGTVSFKFVRGSKNRRSVALFRWSYTEPAVQEIISDGKMMWVYLPENRQVIESDISQVEQQGQNPVTFLSNLENLSRDFVITSGTPATDAKGNYRLVLVPHQPSTQFAGMEVVVLKAAVDLQQKENAAALFPLVETTVTDVQGNSTAIEFSQIRINPGLEASFFAFSKPDGVEVLTPAEQLSFQ